VDLIIFSGGGGVAVPLTHVFFGVPLKQSVLSDFSLFYSTTLCLEHINSFVYCMHARF
jgi:hypothetical protein